jgi:hypothetical protein
VEETEPEDLTEAEEAAEETSEEPESSEDMAEAENVVEDLVHEEPVPEKGEKEVEEAGRAAAVPEDAPPEDEKKILTENDEKQE